MRLNNKHAKQGLHYTGTSSKWTLKFTHSLKITILNIHNMIYMYKISEYVSIWVTQTSTLSIHVYNAHNTCH